MELLEAILIFVALLQIFRNKLALPLVIIVALYDTNWLLGFNVSTLAFVHNVQDTGLVLMLILAFRLMLRKQMLPQNPVLSVVKKGVLVFALFFLLLTFIDITYNGTPLMSAFKVFRGWLCMLMLWLVNRFKRSEIEQFIKYLLVVTMVSTLIFISEAVFNIQISDARLENSERAAQPWTPGLFVFLLLLVRYYKISKWLNVVCVTIIIVDLVLCGSRSLFIAYFAVAIIAIFFKTSRISLKKVGLAVILIGVVTLTFSTDNMLSRRFEDANTDMEAIAEGSESAQGNMSFRMLILGERMNYLNQSNMRMVFGLGFIQERDLKEELFYIGKENKERPGRVIQVETADIAWANLFLRYGYLGTAIYICLMFIPMVIVFFKQKRNVAMYSIGLYMMAHVLAVSFTYAVISNSLFWFTPIVVARLLGYPKDKLQLKTSSGLIVSQHDA